MGNKKQNNRQISIKTLLLVTTWVAVAVAMARYGEVNDNDTLFLIGIAALIFFIDCIIGFMIAGWKGAFVGGVISFGLLLFFLSEGIL